MLDCTESLRLKMEDILMKEYVCYIGIICILAIVVISAQRLIGTNYGKG